MNRLILMGVAGCGKSSVGMALATRIGADYLDGDDLHPPENIARMSRGEPLTDDDRWPWLEQVGRVLGATRTPLIVGCSALKRIYRDCISREAGQQIGFIHLRGSQPVIAARMQARQGHFMPPALLASQFAALEAPQPDENAISVDIEQPLAAIIDCIEALLDDSQVGGFKT